MASPGHEFPECFHPSVKEQDEDDAPSAPLTPQEGINSNKSVPSTPPQPAPHPQPRARKLVAQKPESEDGMTSKQFHDLYMYITETSEVIIAFFFFFAFCRSESDWEADNLTSPSKSVKPDTPLQNTAELQAVVPLGEAHVLYSSV